jgi:tetratricopeptide (TPR) repeat protein
MSRDIEQQLQRLQQQAAQLVQAGQYEQALDLAVQACNLAYAQYGENHPASILSLRALADMYQALGRYSEVEPLYRQAVDVLLQRVGKDDPILVDSMAALGETYEALGNYAMAEPLLRQAQLAMKARYPDPLCWGAFICQGDPGPLSGR